LHEPLQFGQTCRRRCRIVVPPVSRAQGISK
jgi:hypothetical protein